MWPFKKKPVMTQAEYSATRPIAPCGKQETHVYWTDLQGFPCPACYAIESKKDKEQEENRMAEKIAEAVVRKLKR